MAPDFTSLISYKKPYIRLGNLFPTGSFSERAKPLRNLRCVDMEYLNVALTGGLVAKAD
jgi:hypothetical protein